jgi:hypothetical protein
LDEARRIEGFLSSPVAIEVELLGGLFRGMLAIARGDFASAYRSATELQRRAQESGYWMYAVEAAQLMSAAENPPPLDKLPAFVCVHTH